MATFSQWWKGFRKAPQVRPVTWLCGTEKILIEDVLSTIKRVLGATDWNYVPLVLGEDSPRAVWSEIFSSPQGARQARLVVVRNAERLTNPERILEFARRADAHPNAYVVLVSSAAALPRLDPTEDQKHRRAKGDIVPYLADLKTRGHLVECKPFTQDTAKVAVEWVQARTKMRENVAAYLLDRANGDMRLVRDVCNKVTVFGHEATISAINELLSEQPRDTLVDALVALNKKEALAALERLQPDEYSRTVGLLDSQLDLAGLIHDMSAAHHTTYEIQRAAGNKNFLVKDLLPVARTYDAKRRSEIRKTLSVADEALRAGARTGVMEAIIASW